jgi:hypothetical protein
VHVGVMADEVEKVHPEAVIDGPFGFKLVDYHRAVSPVNDNVNLSLRVA